jgi:glutaredoxin-related protein
VKGQFVGGCDIVKEMHQDGSLEELLIREKILKKE